MKHLCIRAVCIFLFVSGIQAQSYNAVLFNGTGLGWQEKLTALALAGIVNRDSSRLYLLNVYETWSNTKTDETWRDIYIQRGNVQFETYQLLRDLITRFRPFIQGAITYDPNKFYGNFSGQNFNFQAEQAAVIAGLSNCLPMTATTASVLGLPVKDSVLLTDSFNGDSPRYVIGRLELSTHPWNQSGLSLEQQYLSLIDYSITNILPVCNPKKLYIREITDWAIQQKMFQVNFAGTDDLDFNSLATAKADRLEFILNYLHGLNPSQLFHIYGWIRPEPLAQWFAYFGASFHETLLANISFHKSFPVVQGVYTPPAAVNPDTLQLQNKYYIVFIGTEGDAGNWVFGQQAGAWQSAQRGAVPLGWGWNLHLLNECPFVAQYYYATGTKNDGFVSVISPLGYAYPDLFQSDVRAGAVTEATALMNKFGTREIYGYKHYAPSTSVVYRGKTISNSYNFSKYGAFQKDIGAQLTFVFDPLLGTQQANTSYSGALLFNHLNDNTFYGNVSDLNAAAANILSIVRNKPKPGFFLAGYQRLRQDDYAGRTDPANSDITLPRLLQLISLLKADTGSGASIEVVTPETYSVLLRKKLGLLGTQEFATAQPRALSLFPNPAAQTITLSGVPAGSNIQVFNILGEAVAEEINDGLMNTEAGSTTLNVQKLRAGIYLCVVTGGGKRQTIKFAVKK